MSPEPHKVWDILIQSQAKSLATEEVNYKLTQRLKMLIMCIICRIVRSFAGSLLRRKLRVILPRHLSLHSPHSHLFHLLSMRGRFSVPPTVR